MKALATLLWLIWSSAVSGQTILVQSKDLPGTTRLVLELPGQSDWQMGRTDDGYELRIADANVQFDVTGVFSSIDRSRLAAIWRDPASGGLRLGVACACYALPFEFRPGILVIDLRDGPPPTGSSFEMSLDGAPARNLSPRPNRRPQARPKWLLATAQQSKDMRPQYDWVGAQAGTAPPAQKPGPDRLPIRTGFTDISPLKDALLRQLSRGAAQGIVQMAQPTLASRNAATPLPLGPRANIRIGEMPGYQVATAPAAENTLIKEGAACIADDKLALSDWGTGKPAAALLAESHADLVGEFDRPNPQAVSRATKILLYLGFGAEARQVMEKLPVEEPDRAIWTSLAKLVDGGSDPAGPFAGMQTCDTAAALWAVLATPEILPSEKPRNEAVLRTFSALPAHLRRSLGPDLAARFLVFGDLATSRSISQATQRGMTGAMPEVTVMAATLDLASGDPAAASAQLAPGLAEAGPATAQTLIALVDSRIAAGQDIAPDTSTALAALIREQAGSALEPALRRARILALAATGGFDQAFELLPATPAAEGMLWKILAGSGSDTAILNHAVLPLQTAVPAIPADQRSQIATKLFALGLPEVTLRWIGPPTPKMTDGDRILAAKATLSIGDPQAALGWVTGLDDAIAADLRAQAQWKQGKPQDAAQTWSAAQDPAAELRANGWAGNWGYIAKSDASAWQAAAALVADGSAPVTEPAGPLALGNDLVAQSATTRATLAALLASVQSPVAQQ